MTKPRHAIFAHIDPFKKDSKTFEEEIKNLSKYFYAEVIKNNL